MKTLSCLFSIYFITLSILPCDDGCAESDFFQTEIASFHFNESAGHQDVCSPFCGCQCCGCTIAFVLPMTIKAVNFTPSSQPDFFIRQNLPSISFSFWHPPKI
ncbi:MAG TPA: DUF6660 family protein [Chitinophagales bacterium]|nr:DUF6660 family protein [Chitinophagales bacterium]